MASPSTRSLGPPSSTHNPKSFSRIEPKRASPLRSRSSTLSHGDGPSADVAGPVDIMTEVSSRLESEDVFDKGSPVAQGAGDYGQPLSPQQLPQGFDDLPIELISLIDRFLESLTVKAHNTPPSIERISQRFQDFYMEAESPIATHINALSARQARDSSPSPSISSKTSVSAKERVRSSSSGDSLAAAEGAKLEQQMLTPQEISDRRKARRLLEQKRLALEEAVERQVCERIYKRIWRHRSTLDEVRDEKLRSRTAALALVGIGLPDLGVSFDTAVSSEESTKPPDPSVENYISRASHELLAMNDAQCPLGKLQHLAAAHKSIVDLLTNLHQSSSSADEILPTLIYTLITTPPEGINVISNLHFTQRFRNATKIDGEAAYCLTNLEAAISFLETVDLATLRSDEPLEGPPKSTLPPQTPSKTVKGNAPGMPLVRSTSSPTTTLFEPNPISTRSATVHPLESPPQTPDPEESTSSGRPPSHNRRVSDLFQPTNTTLNTAITTADQGLKTIGLTLDNSFKFLFGRLKEQQLTSPTGHTNSTVLVPRTLDDARRLVEPKPLDEEDATVSGASSIAEHQLDGATYQTGKPSVSEEKLLGLFAGRPQPRDRSADSAVSSNSSKRVAFAPASSTQTTNSRDRVADPPPQAVNSPIESMRNFGNSINPLKGFTGMNVMRGFGRSVSSGTTPGPTLLAPTGTGTDGERPKKPKERETEQPATAAAAADGGGGQVNGAANVKFPPAQRTTTTADADATKAEEEEPPIGRFLEVDSVGDLKVAELEVLLRDYKRLAGVLKER
ncbi:MAG: hypothetical protein Q9191_005383 [Dirinaria sp. TL-2023a]